MKRVLVTGGCGFIGSHIAENLLRSGFEVIILDNLSTGRVENLKTKEISFCYGDIVRSELDNVFAAFKPDYVIHQAAQVSVHHSINDFYHDANVNIQGTINIINACKKYGVQKIVFSSSAAIYGNTQTQPITIDHPIKPTSPYGLSKYTSEEYLKLAKELYDIDYVILRYSNVYGPRQNFHGEGGVIPTFFDKLITNQQPVIFGGGHQTRDFIYVEDVSRANLKALEYDSCGVFNISNSHSISINKLFFVMKDICNSHLMPSYQAAREGDIENSQLCNKESIEALKWNPLYSLEEGLMMTHHYYHDALSQQLVQHID